jgi:circadian clock protein KaiB
MISLIYSSGYETVVPLPSNNIWEFELYVNDGTRRSTIAKENLFAFCDKHLEGHCHVEVYDLAEHPELGFKNNICVTPTLIKRSPSPVRTLVGDLTDMRKMQDYLCLPSPAKKPSGENVYREGLRKQRLSSREHHAPGRG